MTPDMNGTVDSVKIDDVVVASPYERDIAGQPHALREFIDAPRVRRPVKKSIDAYDRVIVTGMGSSHAAGARTWRRLVAAGIPAWWIDTASLLDSVALVTSRTLVIATSQSGASGEIVTLLEELRNRRIAAEIIGITNDETSLLAQGADQVIYLRSGQEATVSTKSYVNSLAAHETLASVLLGDVAGLPARLETGFGALAGLGEVASEAIADAVSPGARIVLLGRGDHVATTIFGALILKEAAKVPAEGFVAGNFRHGPLEIAGPGLVAFVIGIDHNEGSEPLCRLAADVAASGSRVLTFGAAVVGGCTAVRAPAYEGFAGLCAGAQLCHRVSVEVAHRKGLVPGEFRFGQKVTGL